MIQRLVAEWPRTALALTLLAVALVAIGPGLLPGRTPMPLDLLGLFAPWRTAWLPPENALLGDVVLHVADRISIADAWRSGHLPLWAPAIMAGHPMAGDSSMQPFFPLHIVPAALFGVQTAFTLQLVLQLWLAGLAMAAWVRTLTRGWLPAFAAALVWMLAAYQQYWRAYPQFLGTLMWLPLVAAAWERAARSGDRRWTALGGAAVALTVLGGQVQFTAFGAILLAAYGAGRCAAFDRPRRGHALRAAVLIALLGFALGAIGLLPAADLARESIRPPFDRRALVATGVPLRQLITVLAPWFLGDPRAGNYVGAQNASEMALYVGILPLLLALATPWARRDRLTLLVAVVGTTLALVALGTPIAWPLASLPYVRQFGLMRWLSLWPLVAALLVGLGVDAVQRAHAANDPAAGFRLRRAAAWLAAAALAAIMLAAVAMAAPGTGTDHTRLSIAAWTIAVARIVVSVAVLAAWTKRPDVPARCVAVLVLILLDLLTFARGYTPDAPRTSHFPHLAPLDDFDGDPAAGRIAVLQQGRSIVLGPQVAPSVGLVEIGGYSSAVRASYRTFLDRLSDATDDPYLSQNGNMLTLAGLRPVLAQLLNVRYVLASEPLGDVVREAVPEAAAAAGGLDPCTATTNVVLGQRVAATFVADAEGLNQIDVPLALPAGGAAAGAIAVHLFRAGDEVDHLAYGVVGSSGAVDVANPSDPADPADPAVLTVPAAPVHIEWRTLYFDPIAGSRGRRYTVAVDLPTGGARGDTAPDSPDPPRVCTPGGRLMFRAWGRAAPLPGTRVASANGVEVLRTDAALGRAWLVPVAVAAASQSDALDRVTAVGFDARQIVVVETTSANPGTVAEPMAVAGSRDDGAAGGARGAGSADDAEDAAQSPAPIPIQVVDDGPNALRVSLPPRSTAGWLVLAEPYAPGWHARVDGAPAAVVRADGGVRAVAVPAGAGDVQLWYRPASVRWGLWLGAIGWVALIALLLLSRRRSLDSGDPTGD